MTATKTKSKPIDREKYESIGIKAGSTKKYYTDHRVIWDKDRNKPLVVAEKDSDGRMCIKTSVTSIQDKLENLGYKDGERKRSMHVRQAGSKQGALSKSQSDKITGA